MFLFWEGVLNTEEWPHRPLSESMLSNQEEIKTIAVSATGSLQMKRKKNNPECIVVNESQLTVLLIGLHFVSHFHNIFCLTLMSTPLPFTRVISLKDDWWGGSFFCTQAQCALYSQSPSHLLRCTETCSLKYWIGVS